jgi:hypothetical protein
MRVRDLGGRARRYLATLGLAAAGYSAQVAILPMSLDYFLRPVHVETASASKECPNAKRNAMAMRAQRTKKEPRGIMRWLL